MDPDLRPINLPPTPDEPPQSPLPMQQQPGQMGQQQFPGQPGIAPEWQQPPVINMSPKASPVRKAVFITLGIVLIAAIGLGAWWWFSQHQTVITNKTPS